MTSLNNLMNSLVSQVRGNKVAVMPQAVLTVNVLYMNTISKCVAFTVADVYRFVYNRFKASFDKGGRRKLQIRASDLKYNLYFRGRFLPNRNIGLVEYGLINGSDLILEVHGLLRGGSKANMTTTLCKRITSKIYTSLTCPQIEDFSFESTIDDIYVERMNKRLRLRARKAQYEKVEQSWKTMKFQIQSGTDEWSMTSQFLQSVTNKLDSSMIKLIEDVLLLVAHLVKSKTKTDYVLAVVTFAKLRTAGPLVGSVVERLQKFVLSVYFDTYMKTPEIQSLEDSVQDFRDVLSRWETTKDTILGKKLRKVALYFISFGVFEHIGVTHDDLGFSKYEVCSRGLFSKADFVYSMIDAVSLTIQRGLLFNKTGKWETFLHGEHSYTKWIEKYTEIKRQSLNFSNLNMYNINPAQFTQDLRDLIEEGDSMVKFTSKDVGFDIRIMKNQVNELKIIQDSLFTKKFAQQTRPAPFGLLIYGGSSIAKSLFTNMLYHFYGKVFNLPTASEFKYNRNSMDPFWSGFNSSMWCIVLDDVAYVNASLGQMDDSLKELIQIQNNVPVVPPQADLADKGKTPVRAELLLATTNTKDMNASAYFSCPLAVQRRLPWVINLKIKKDYARDDSPEMVDPSKLPPLNGEYPNFWNIVVERVVKAEGSNGRDFATHEPLYYFDDIKLFLKWYGEVITEYKNTQNRALVANSDMSNIDICNKCFSLKNECSCSLNIQYETNSQVAWRVYGHGNWSIDELETNYFQYLSEFDHMEFDIWLEQYKDMQDSTGNTANNLINLNYWINTSRNSYKSLSGYYDNIYEVQSDGNSYFTKFVTWCSLNGARCLYGLGITSIFSIYFGISYMLQRTMVRFFYRNAVFTSSVPGLIMRLVAHCMISSYMSSALMQGVVYAIWNLPIVGYYLRWWINKKLERMPYGQVIKFAGIVAQKSYVNRRWIAAIAGCTVVLAMWKVFSATNKLFSQGNVSTVEDSHFEKEERENVWKRDDYETTPFDLDPMQLNYTQLSFEQIKQKILRNSSRFSSKVGTKIMNGNMFSVGGHLWVTNNHLLLNNGEIQLTIINEKPVEGISTNAVVYLEQSQLQRFPENDLVFFELFALDACSDITSLIAKSTFGGNLRGAYVGKNKLVEGRSLAVKSICKMNYYVEQFDQCLPVWSGTCEENTINGDCGTVLLALSPSVTILGLHVLGGNMFRIMATALTQEIVQEARKRFSRPLIQSGVPKINTPSTLRVLGPLHHKSTFRWLQDGSAKVFGSYLGFRPRPRSRVVTTLLGDTIKNDREWTIKEVKPNMADWRPWHFAAKDITSQTHNVKMSVLDKAVKGYTNDILSGLKPKDFSNLKIISKEASVNGIQGVRFLDKLNFNTSMGEPYNHTKKFHLQPSPTPELPDAKTFDKEVWDEFDDMLNRYKHAVRACPIFSGSVKDEPRDEVKASLGKLRIFSGASTVWCLIVRMYLLTFVKVLQENQILFEAGPGCVAQSLEWEKFREHLTKFGPGKIVAGDYGKFDKKMGAVLIVRAFDIIIAILTKAGWSDEELLVVYGIAEDTAYSYCQFNGDLVMWMGSNPSGHPLTVIVNSIVNSLYMRYCYVILNPEQECSTFKSNVALLTYGDDNIMGVCDKAPWFNHTAIVNVLADIGVEYTMADKSSISVPYIHIDDVQFLKRSWRWDMDIGAYVCPLEEASIRKMLCICVRSRTISAEAQMIASMNSAVQEWFWYGKSKFEFERTYLVKLAMENGLEAELVNSPFPTWDTLVQRFWDSSKHVKIARLGVATSS